MHPSLARVLEAAAIAGVTKVVTDGIDKVKRLGEAPKAITDRLDKLESRMDAVEKHNK